MKPLFALLLLLVLGAAREPILVPEVSQHEVLLRQGFTGTELLLFGAVLNPEGTRAAQDYDIIIVLKGPTQSIVVREKQKVAGIWINVDSAELRSAPSYYAIASTRPISQIVDDKTAAIYELGLKWLQLSPIGSIDPAEQARFAAGLVKLNSGNGLYRQEEGAVKVSEQVLYQARIGLPSRVPIGTYTAETFAVSKGRVVASASSTVEVRKIGIERAIAAFSDRYGLLYGLLAVVVSIGMGWLAGRVFALV
ncbi:TIGR02186 family protein [Novosphingobium sp. 9U]|uniref:TIGR02186 family protein n=1 Tax=Novosphingobium sp. 9U TaxID=2653158 RepID=UPI0012F26FA5|nr:TIGR02186 family protein [Novosphingobium sp. 9U]VWX47024.1 Transmembrane protein [Novosphingobium sp. 9U]